MYNWVDDRRLLCSKNLPSLSFIPKQLNNFIRRGNNHWNNFNQLPVIKEEEGFISDEEIELKEFLVPTHTPNENYSRKNCFIGSTSNNSVLRRKETRDKEWVEETKTSTKLPLVNINCLMNFDVKNTQHVWETSFGRRLINGNSVELKTQDNKDVPCSKMSMNRKGGSKFGNNQCLSSHRPLVSKWNSIQDRNNKNGGGDREGGFSRPKNIRRKYKKTNKDVKIPMKKVNSGENSSAICNADMKSVKSSSKYTESHGNHPSGGTSSLTKNQHFLSECVKDSLNTVPTDEITCEHCEEKFPKVDDLVQHMKKHEEKKETCLLCDKIFYRPNDFIQHLLSHEGVDKFSCKKCKKHFQDLNRYREHYKDVHFIPSKTSANQLNVEYVKKWLPKYECKRCKVEFETVEAQRAHKKNHIKKDLTEPVY